MAEWVRTLVGCEGCLNCATICNEQVYKRDNWVLKLDYKGKPANLPEIAEAGLSRRGMNDEVVVGARPLLKRGIGGTKEVAHNLSRSLRLDFEYIFFFDSRW